LLEAPYAFGSTWELEKDRSEEAWRRAVASRIRFVAELDAAVVGMAAVGESGYERTASITSVWVDPEARGRGVGDSLVVATFEWAREAGYDQVLLWVAEGNPHAEKLYERHGFSRTGERSRIRDGEDRYEFEMSVRF
jgi:ribosomal protein S18 acetylase RimI-like enzyme